MQGTKPLSLLTGLAALVSVSTTVLADQKTYSIPEMRAMVSSLTASAYHRDVKFLGEKGKPSFVIYAFDLTDNRQPNMMVTFPVVWHVVDGVVVHHQPTPNPVSIFLDRDFDDKFRTDDGDSYWQMGKDNRYHPEPFNLKGQNLGDYI